MRLEPEREDGTLEPTTGGDQSRGAEDLIAVAER